MNEAYVDTHSVHTKLNDQKEHVRQVFTDTVSNKTGEIIASNLLCAKLKVMIIDKMKGAMTVKVIKEMHTRYE